jgi:hypothetical protein
VPLDTTMVCMCFECVPKGLGVGNLGHNVEVLKEGGASQRQGLVRGVSRVALLPSLASCQSM